MGTNYAPPVPYLEFRYQIIVSSIKFRKCFAKLMIPIALLEVSELTIYFDC